MPIQRQTVYRANSRRRSTLPLLLYDLKAASQTLPLAAVLPEQFYHAPTLTHAVHGEIALMRAVLEDAVNCFQRQPTASGKRAQRLAREAEDWFFSDDANWPFSFLNICAALDIDPDYIRLGLKRWRQELSTEPQKKKRRRTVVARRPLKIAA